MRGVEALKAQLIHHTLVFGKVVMAAPFLDNFKMPTITPYDGKGDPAAHVEVFHS